MGRYSLPQSTLFEEADHSISPECENFHFAVERLGEVEARDYYLHSGHLVAQSLLAFLADRGRNPGAMSLLDFANGYGRITRYFVRRFREVLVSDLEDDMLEFCRSRFGTPGFRSVDDPAKPWQVNRRFDLVFCHSLFTGLPETTWFPWFRRLAELVESGGYLVISTQGAKFAAKLLGEDPSTVGADDGPAFDFVAGNETRGRLDPRRYGTAFVSDRFVRAAAAGVPGIELLQHFEAGAFDLFHDVYAFGRR
jgi:hypothetical protein